MEMALHHAIKGLVISGLAEIANCVALSYYINSTWEFK